MKSAKIDPKASAILPENTPKAPAQACVPKAQSVGDAYCASAANPYKGLLGGKAECIEGGVLSEMYYASSEGPRVRRDAYDAIQDILRGIMDTDTRELPPTDINGDIPYVPELHKDILKGKLSCKSYEYDAVIQRYAALEKTLVAMANTAYASLDPANSWAMNADEIRSLKSYCKKIEEALFDCRREMGLAKKAQLHELEAEQKAAALEAAKEDDLDPDLEGI